MLSTTKMPEERGDADLQRDSLGLSRRTLRSRFLRYVASVMVLVMKQVERCYVARIQGRKDGW